MARWGAWVGVGMGVVLVAIHRLLPLAFSTQDDVRLAIAAGLLVVAVLQPLSGPEQCEQPEAHRCTGHE